MRADEDRHGGRRRGDNEYGGGGGGGQEEAAPGGCCSCLPPFCGFWGSRTKPAAPRPKVGSFAADGGKKQRKSGSKSLPQQTVTGGGGGGGGGDAAAPAKETAPPAWQPCPRPAPGELAGVKRAPSKRHGSFRRNPGGGGGGRGPAFEQWRPRWD
ncbi:hypothetical protein OsJ_31946 [Oryza sativa Japonica Group]|uniref:Uncharacterized protein n=1 Tax=Oryza sativa subsp. japonica TaxID=39947 RepID=A3C5W3_ORYSJ|nr:hypothetical protein OsJ_31946 [Oryza sativa Japonica Group]